MSPRAAWRLEAAGFSPVYDYVAGKSDWLAADLPFEGTAQLAGMCRRRLTPPQYSLPGQARAVQGGLLPGVSCGGHVNLL